MIFNVYISHISIVSQWWSVDFRNIFGWTLSHSPKTLYFGIWTKRGYTLNPTSTGEAYVMALQTQRSKVTHRMV